MSVFIKNRNSKFEPINNQTMNAQKVLKEFTTHVRKTKGSGEALIFYAKYILPIEEYFGGDDEVENLELPLEPKREHLCYLCQREPVVVEDDICLKCSNAQKNIFSFRKSNQ